jgi:hypothetical protein
MSSLADLPELIGFFSYSREDDEDSRGSLSALRDGIQRELSAQLGRSKRSFRLWQDHEAIAPGKLWETEIKAAIDQSVFAIPIVTPRAVNSKYCKFEFESFLAREMALGRNDLVFPILYISVDALQDETKWRSDPVLSTIGRRQYVDWRELRHLDSNASIVRETISRFCRKILEALNEPWEPQETHNRREASEAQHKAEEEQRRGEEENHARQAAATEAEHQLLERQAAATREAEEKAHQEQRLKQEDNDERRDEAEAKRHLERKPVPPPIKVQSILPPTRWQPSKSLLLALSLLGIVLLGGSIGVWLLNTYQATVPREVTSAPSLSREASTPREAMPVPKPSREASSPSGDTHDLAPPSGTGSDEIAWNYIRETKDPAQLRRFISEFPSSPRSSEAKALLSSLASNAQPQAPSVSNVSPQAPAKPVAKACFTFNGQQVCN